MITESARPLEAFDIRHDIRSLEYDDPIIVRFKSGNRIINRCGNFRKLGFHNLIVATASGRSFRIPIVSIVAVTVLTPLELEQYQEQHR